MSINDSNFSATTNQSNDSTSTSAGEIMPDTSSRSSVPDFIQIPLLSLTIILAIFYTTLILIRPTFRTNKLNWFTINLCLMSALLSIALLGMGIKRVMNVSSSSLPCRLQGYLLYMTACQLMYSHVVIAISRYLSIVYASKHFFRSTLCILSCLGLGWITAILVAIPYLLIDGFICAGTQGGTFLSYYTLVITIVIPAMIVLICNIRIFWFVHQSSRRVHTEGAGSGVSHSRDMHLLKTMIATFIVFIAGWLPVFLTQAFSQTFSISSTTDSIFQVLPTVSMLSDVILLIYINQPMRLFLKQLIFKQRRVVMDKTVTNKAKTNANTVLKH